MTVNLIGLCGPRGVGKSTIARGIAHAASRGLSGAVASFADPLKRQLMALCTAAGVPREEALLGVYMNRERELPFAPGRTYRQALQTLGTEWGRNCMGEDFWVNVAMAGLDAYDDATIVVFDDVRYRNEADAIHQRGGLIIEVTRPGIAYTGEHASERGLPDYCVDARIANEGQTPAAAVSAIMKIVEGKGWV